MGEEADHRAHHLPLCRRQQVQKARQGSRACLSSRSKAQNKRKTIDERAGAGEDESPLLLGDEDKERRNVSIFFSVHVQPFSREERFFGFGRTIFFRLPCKSR